MILRLVIYHSMLLKMFRYSSDIMRISHISNITSFYRTFGCPIIYMDTYSQFYFGHWHL